MMPFEQSVPVVWWHGAEPLPPKPDAPEERLKPVAPVHDADTAGILAAGHKALDRIAARAEAPPKDARFAALERVARAAQDARTGRNGCMGTAFVEMCRALDALAALDGG